MTLAALRPEVAALWDREKNGCGADEVPPNSHKRAYWRCGRGHSWSAKVYAVTGCPYCAGNRPIPGETDLATTDPALAAQWDREKNALLPTEVSAGSGESAWWRCPAGHSYRAPVYARHGGTDCPYCAGKKVLPGFNDLATTDPELLAEWDGEKNDLLPGEINRGSHKKVWWRCALGHSYAAAPYARAAGNGCPYCAGRKVLPGFNDLATTHPALAAQWAEGLNGSLRPEQLSKGSNKKVWWECASGHVWQAAVYSRTRERSSGCPVCAGSVKRRGEKLPPERRITPPIRMPETLAV